MFYEENELAEAESINEQNEKTFMKLKNIALSQSSQVRLNVES